MDLREYSESILTNLKNCEDENMAEILNQQEDLAHLYMEMSASGNILLNIEEMLTKFESGLGNISSEIKSLQSQTLNLSVQMNNRKDLDNKLKHYVSQVMIAPELTNKLLYSEIDEGYIIFVNQLKEKLKYIKFQGKIRYQDQEIIPPSMKDIIPVLRNISDKVTWKIKNFIWNFILSIVKPRINMTLLQESMLKYKDFLQFLRENSQENYVELCMKYTEAMSSVNFSYFKAYMAGIKKKIKDDSTKLDVIISEISDHSLWKVRGFELNNRHSIIDSLETLEPITSDNKKESFYIERLFQSACISLMSSFQESFAFTLDFFGLKPEQYNPIFGDIYIQTFQNIIDTFALLFSNTYDVLGLLLVLRINSALEYTIEKKNMTALLSFFERVRMICWPRLQFLLDTNLREMEKAYYLRATDITLHPLTSRFTQFIVSLHKISPTDDMFRQRLALFKRALMHSLTRLSQDISDEKNRTVFLINNLDYLITEFNDQGLVLSDDFLQLEGDLNNLIEIFLKMQLKEVFGALMGIIENPEKASPEDVETVLKDFNINWKKGIHLLEVIEKDLFTGKEIQKDILRRTYTTFLMDYNDFVEIIKRSYLHLSNLLVSARGIMAETQR
ncbi:unnamed protein product [Blepharisma stoltei]|uniref:Uncharacterized protein n=1 Tax=Blepharisma stoltei TaxID=1481888 RepID=A0AAU9IY20_9CILI|nr:unnamed protein product [Blepharisma stoltei]